jgi:hypothetical protein
MAMFSKEVGFFDAMFEGDKLQIVKEVVPNSPHMNIIGHFVESAHQTRVVFLLFLDPQELSMLVEKQIL